MTTVRDKLEQAYAQAAQGKQGPLLALEAIELSVLEDVERTAGKEAVDGYRAWRWYQFSRCISLFRSIRHLLANGCCLEALALVRPMLETYVLLRWVDKSPAERFTRATTESMESQRRRTVQRLADAGIQVPDTLMERVRQTESAKSLPNLRQMAEDVGFGELSIAPYSLLSSVLHGDGAELYLIMKLKGKTISADPYPSSDGFELGWLSAYAVLREVYEYFGTEHHWDVGARLAPFGRFVDVMMNYGLGPMADGVSG